MGLSGSIQDFDQARASDAAGARLVKMPGNDIAGHAQGSGTRSVRLLD
jgi:hypothetical protein